MTLIAMAVHDTEENGRSKLTEQTLWGIYETVDFHGFYHHMIVVDNGSCAYTKEILENFVTKFNGNMEVITLEENVGTARAINKVWMRRKDGQHCLKMDNDVTIEDKFWLDTLEECIERDPTLGIVGLKRKDCIETPWHTDPWYRSQLVMLPHEEGQRWLIVEKVNHVMGTCQLYSSACLEKIGYLYQLGGLYGFDDALASVRAQVAGFWTAHYPHIEIYHNDVTDDPKSEPYSIWKDKHSGMRMDKYTNYKKAYMSGRLPVYHGPEDE